MTSTKRVEDLRKRRKSQGLVRVEVWVPEKYKDYLKEAARLYRDGDKGERDVETTQVHEDRND